MRAFLEKINNDWLDDFVYITKYPLERLGYEVIPFDGDDMENFLISKNPTKEDIIIGSVQVTTKFFNHIGIETPKYIGFPDHLKKFYNRNITIESLGSIKREFPYFIKPHNDVKLFTGDIISSTKNIETLKRYCGIDIDNNTKIYVSDIINIISEYRCFVHEGKLKGIHYYSGDFKKYIDPSVVEEIINTYKDSPVAYTIDVALTNDGKTVIIEINDMWAIGSYGFDSEIYSLMCVRRMKEIINNKKN